MNSTSVVSQSTHGVAIELDSQSSSRLLERAQRANLSLSLTFSRCDQEELICAQIQGAGASAFTMAVVDGQSVDLLPGACLDVRFSLDGQEFFFSSSILCCGEADFEIGRPDRLHTWQRRRFLRARLVDSANVTLTHAGSFGQARGEGAILNVSQDGLACRVSRELADSLRIDETIGVVFELGPQRTRIECNGRIKGKTAAGSAHSIIVGVHFEHDTESPEMMAHLSRLLSP